MVFSKNAAHDVEQALTELQVKSHKLLLRFAFLVIAAITRQCFPSLQDRGVEAVLLDLRDNVGGVVLSAYQVRPFLTYQSAITL